MRRRLASFATLTKVSISVASTFTAATGWVAYARGFGTGIVTVCAGTLLLAMASSALNEWQERDLDAQMERTRHRPIPSGEMLPSTVLVIVALLTIAGTALLGFAHGRWTLALGLAAMIWYNGVYTPLKRRSAFAVVPGSIIGALPPAIGWTAAGGNPWDKPILALAFFFFIWQVPHFWLLLFRHGRDYARAGLPTLTQVFSTQQLARLTFMWMNVTAASGLLLPLFRVSESGWVAWGLVAAGLYLGHTSYRVIRSHGDKRAFQGAFIGINIYALVVMALLAIDVAL